tara:strand:+ start:48 stop:719 length:672 start_codon:yes stop_codon:yes gene_type:complete
MSNSHYISELAIIILAFNEEKNLKAVINKAKKYGIVIVVNDGSIDQTKNIAQDNANFIINNLQNFGYDVSIKKGFEFAISKNFKYLITIDGDNQHPIEKIPFFVKLLKQGKSIVVGNRDLKPRYLEKIFSFLSFNLWGIKDPMCGMKAFRIEHVKSITTLYSYNSIGTEIMFQVLKNFSSYENIDIKISNRKGKSKFGYSIKLNILIIKNIIKSLQFKYSRRI